MSSISYQAVAVAGRVNAWQITSCLQARPKMVAAIKPLIAVWYFWRGVASHRHLGSGRGRAVALFIHCNAAVATHFSSR